jgi:predicted small integral membrane protein
MPIPPVDNRVIPAVRYLDTPTATSVHTPISDAVTTPVMGMDGSGLTGSTTGDTIATLSAYTTMDLVQMFVVYSFIAAAGLSAVFVFIGGINFILSGGNDEKIKTAVNTIRYAIVGLIVTILSFTFVTIVGRIFGLDFMSYLSYDKIRTSITQLIESSQGTSSTPHFRLPRN